MSSSIRRYLSFAGIAAALVLRCAMSSGALAANPPAEVSRHVVPYQGKLGHHGAIRIDVAASRARV
jgi:hypothetical protein